MNSWQCYVWDNLVLVTGAYHNTGGVLVITDGDPIEVLARFMNGQSGNYGTTYEEWAEQVVLSEVVYLGEILHHDFESVFIFPDAGCC